jgi:DnaK suppressor protein
LAASVEGGGHVKRTPVSEDGRQQREAYRRVLLDKKAEVLAKLGLKFDALAAMGRVAEDDQAAISHDEFVLLRLNSLDYDQLRLVEEALERMRRGGFGVCQQCGEPISRKRLQAIPWARNCIGCQNLMAAPPSETQDTGAVSPELRTPW